MAKKRMFNLGVLDTDAFLDMPLSAQALYFHLCLRADDDGFIGNPKRITQNVGASVDDLKLLVAKRFVLTFEDGVIVIKHWRMHNAIKKDRYTQTNYAEDLRLLDIKENGAYTMRDVPLDSLVEAPEHERSTNGAQMSQTCSADKIRLGKDSIGQSSIEQDSIGECEGERKPTYVLANVTRSFGKYVRLTTNEFNKLLSEFGTTEFYRRKDAVDVPENEGKDFVELIRECLD